MDIVEKPFMNMAIFIIPMKSAWYKVSNKHLNFEIRSSDTREPPSYTHIQMSMFWILRESYDFSDEFFLINWGISKVFHAKKPCTSQILRSKIFKNFLSVGNCSKKNEKKVSVLTIRPYRIVINTNENYLNHSLTDTIIHQLLLF